MMEYQVEYSTNKLFTLVIIYCYHKHGSNCLSLTCLYLLPASVTPCCLLSQLLTLIWNHS